MSEKYFYRKSENVELENVILEARKHAGGAASEFLFRIEQAEIDGSEERIGAIVHYEIRIRPDPKAPPENHPYLQFTVDRHVGAEQYPYIALQIIRTVERYWKDKRESAIADGLSADSVRLLQSFKEHRQMKVDDFLSNYTRMELEAYSAISVVDKVPRVYENDKSLIELVNAGVVHVEQLGAFKTAFITSDGMRVASRLSKAESD